MFKSSKTRTRHRCGACRRVRFSTRSTRLVRYSQNALLYRGSEVPLYLGYKQARGAKSGSTARRRGGGRVTEWALRNDKRLPRTRRTRRRSAAHRDTRHRPQIITAVPTKPNYSGARVITRYRGRAGSLPSASERNVLLSFYPTASLDRRFSEHRRGNGV